MKVALLAPLFESVPPKLYGGTERVVYNLSRGLTRAGIDVTVFASGDSHCDGTLVPVIDEAIRLRKTQAIDPNLFHFRMLSTVAQRANEFDIIHNHHDYWMLPLTEMVRTPVLTTVHGRLDIPELPPVLSGFPNAYYVSISDSQRTPLRNLPWLRTIYHGLEMSKYSFRETPGKYLAFLGRIDPQKRPDLAIRMAKRSGVPLKIAAKIEGKQGQEYYDKVVKPHVDGRFIEFLGEISDTEKSDFLGNALALAFPIDWPEPFGLVVIEAIACGTPVLARPFGAVPELLRDGLTGFLDFDVDRLSSKIRDIPQISRKFCRRWAEQHFSLERMTEEYIHVYEHLAQFVARGAAVANAGRPSAGITAGSGKSGHYRWNFLHPVERSADGDT